MYLGGKGKRGSTTKGGRITRETAERKAASLVSLTGKGNEINFSIRKKKKRGGGGEKMMTAKKKKKLAYAHRRKKKSKKKGKADPFFLEEKKKKRGCWPKQGKVERYDLVGAKRGSPKKKKVLGSARSKGVRQRGQKRGEGGKLLGRKGRGQITSPLKEEEFRNRQTRKGVRVFYPKKGEKKNKALFVPALEKQGD